MSIALITGSAGLIGAEAARHFAKLGMTVVGVDNGLRSFFFGPEGSTKKSADDLYNELKHKYIHYSMDIRNHDEMDSLFKRYGQYISLVIHAAAQPSHDWAATNPRVDFEVNALGTFNVLEAARIHAPEAPFIFTSTNKVYGDRPNLLPLVEQETRFDITEGRHWNGVNEQMSIDRTLHSVFGASKVSADVMVQEYGKYFGMKTACFRGGTLTGPGHSAVPLHGFLAYLVRCVMEGRTYTINGYKGKMVRDVIHSHDVLTAFEAFFNAPRIGEVYNLGGGRHSNVSHWEAFKIAESIVGRPAVAVYSAENRIGDHKWYISNMAKFRRHYPTWEIQYDVPMIVREIYEANIDKWVPLR